MLVWLVIFGVVAGGWSLRHRLSVITARKARRYCTLDARAIFSLDGRRDRRSRCVDALGSSVGRAGADRVQLDSREASRAS